MKMVSYKEKTDVPSFTCPPLPALVQPGCTHTQNAPNDVTTNSPRHEVREVNTFSLSCLLIGWHQYNIQAQIRTAVINLDV